MDDKTDVDGTLLRRALAMQIIEISNEARLLAMAHDRFAEGDWRTFDVLAERMRLTGACNDEASLARGRAGWFRASSKLGAPANEDYRLALAALFDRVADLHSPAKRLAA